MVKGEFLSRVERLQELMEKEGLDAVAVYGDEYRKESLRYVTGFWPIFERGMCFIPRTGEPVLAGAPEGEVYAKEMSVWPNYVNVKDFACVSVPDAIDYPNAVFSSFKEILFSSLAGGKRLGIVGMWDMPAHILERIQASRPGLQVINCDRLLQGMRIIKGEAEIAALKECGAMACAGYRNLVENIAPGMTEVEAASYGEFGARKAGAEGINFHVFGSGKRADTIIGRPTLKKIEKGDMIMSALAVQYDGYVCTTEYPFVVGTPSRAQRDFLNILFEAANVQQNYLKPGVVMGEMVQAVKSVFRKYKVEKYDIYPPMHGIGLAEAESPYPSEETKDVFKAGMCVNSDISLFGHPGGSNRIEEGFVITDRGPVSLTPYIREQIEKGV